MDGNRREGTFTEKEGSLQRIGPLDGWDEEVPPKRDTETIRLLP